MVYISKLFIRVITYKIPALKIQIKYSSKISQLGNAVGNANAVPGRSNCALLFFALHIFE